MSAFTMSYEGLVEAGREAREQADNMQWVEGDLALQVEALPGDERPRDPETGAFIADEEKALKRYAEDVEIAYSTLTEYRRTAEAWPTPSRLGVVAWDTHRVLASQEDRFELIRPGMTRSEARKIVRQRTAAAAGKPNWGELLGRVGEQLKTAEKHLGKFEEAVGEKTPSDKNRTNAGRYAAWAEDIAGRLREIEAVA